MQARTLFARLRSRAYGRMNNVQRFRFPYTDMSRSPGMFVRHDRSEFYLFDTKRPTIHWNVKPSSLTRSGYVPLEPPCSFGEPGRFGRTSVVTRSRLLVRAFMTTHSQYIQSTCR